MIADEGLKRLLIAIFGEKHFDLEQFGDLELIKARLLLAIDEISLSRPSPARDRMIIFRRFGLDHGKPATLKEIAATVDLSSERVRQIEAIMLRRLRHPHYSRHYSPKAER